MDENASDQKAHGGKEKRPEHRSEIDVGGGEKGEFTAAQHGLERVGAGGEDVGEIAVGEGEEHQSF